MTLTFGQVVIPVGEVSMRNSVVAVPVLSIVTVMPVISSVPLPPFTLSVAVIGALTVPTC